MINKQIKNCSVCIYCDDQIDVKCCKYINRELDNDIYETINKNCPFLDQIAECKDCQRHLARIQDLEVIADLRKKKIEKLEKSIKLYVDGMKQLRNLEIQKLKDIEKWEKENE